MMEFDGKKLLILGATPFTVPLVQKAVSMGIETWVTDNNPDAPAKKVATHPVEIDGFDVEALAKLVLEENIDGIMIGVADILVPIYEKLCRITGRHCYLNSRAVEAFSNKKGFRKTLQEQGLPTIMEYTVEAVLADGFDGFPLFLKPIDNNSAKGTSVVYSHEDFDVAYQKALRFSKSGEVLIQRDLSSAHRLDFLYLIQDGKAALCVTCDEYPQKTGKRTAPVCGTAMTNSYYTELIFDTIHEKMVHMFADLELKNGVFMGQSFLEEGQILLFDPSVRLSGGYHDALMQFYGIDLYKCLISFALSGRLSEENLIEKCNISKTNTVFCLHFVNARCGKIGSIDGLEKIRKSKCVTNVLPNHAIGDVIRNCGTMDHNVMTVYMRSQNRKEIVDSIKDFSRLVSIKDTDGNDMLLESVVLE